MSNHDVSPSTDDSDGDRDKTTVANACGMVKAVLLNQPNWTGLANAAQPLFDWSNAHPPHVTT